MANEILQFVHSIAAITQFMVLAMFVITASCLINIRLYSYVTLNWHSTFYEAQLWRPFTVFFLGSGKALACLMQLYSLYSFSLNLETEVFRNDPLHWNADYLWFIVAFNWFPILVLHQLFSSYLSPFLSNIFIASLGYTWSRHNKDVPMNFYFIPIRARNLPFAGMIAGLFIFGPNALYECVIGCMVGYAYGCIATRSLGPVYFWLFPKKLVARAEWESKKRMAAASRRRGKKLAIASVGDSFPRSHDTGGSTPTNFNDLQLIAAPAFFKAFVRKMEDYFALPNAPPPNPAKHAVGSKGFKLGSKTDAKDRTTPIVLAAETVAEARKRNVLAATASSSSPQNFKGSGHRLGGS